ncbi:LOW QUALITY PROTEIN: phospholipid phosphatase-related protein type 3a [Alosa alosa]|uniref:LOW QUALITY PROTEIN: phospholipid phosphatase-related protein type 3a n=1 Tax=Alosa alosa TaxID=278164 RepID=UPI0020152C54|nr:LOW QUALITY PROTEIN: phospholipid phosphatase-related protein type 3a [Alosa alosa]
MMSPKDKPKKKPPKDSMTLLPCFYFVELPIVASSMISLYFLELTDILQPARVGFRCHDRALSMPYIETGDELIPLLMLLSLAFAGPAASIMIGEALMYCMQSHLKQRRSCEGSINAGGCNFNSFLRRTVRFVGVHVFGLCATALVTDVIQLATGYHTPFFLTVCKPNYTSPGISCEKNPYITQDICSGRDQYAILSARKTFPSQHATLSGFAAVYISMYFNSTISDSTKLLKPLLVFAFAIAGALASLTQITQYRSHPIDVYVGFVIGAGIAVYLALYAVGNFKSPEDAPPRPIKHPQAVQKDALRALTQRGHDSVYQKASASESNDELAGPTHVAGLNRKVRREKASMGSLKRASADVELLAPRSPMGKETMVTFSNTLPRVATNTAEELGNGVGGVGGVGGVYGGSSTTQRHMTFHVPMDPQRSKQLVSEWRQKSIEMRSLSLKDDEQDGSPLPPPRRELQGERPKPQQEEGEEEEAVRRSSGPPPSTLYPTVQAANRGGQPGPVGARVVLPPRPPGAPPLVHIPEEASRPPPVSPKSATTRAKWLSMTEKTAVPVATPEPPRLPAQPRVAQVMAMSKQHGPLAVTSKSSDAGGAGSGGGGSSCATSSTGSESPYYRIPSDRDSGSIVTIDAHAPHHPVVRLSSGNGNPWDWMSTTNGGGTSEAQEAGGGGGIIDGTKSLHRQDSISMHDYHHRPAKADSVGSSASDSSRELPLPPPPHPDLLLDSGHSHSRTHSLSRHSPLHRKPSMSARDWDPLVQPPQLEPDHFFKNLQTDSLSRRYKD